MGPREASHETTGTQSLFGMRYVLHGASPKCNGHIVTADRPLNRPLFLPLLYLLFRSIRISRLSVTQSPVKVSPVVPRPLETVEAAQQSLRGARALRRAQPPRIKKRVRVVEQLVAHDATKPMRAGGAQALYAEDELTHLAQRHRGGLELRELATLVCERP